MIYCTIELLIMIRCIVSFLERSDHVKYTYYQLNTVLLGNFSLFGPMSVIIFHSASKLHNSVKFQGSLDYYADFQSSQKFWHSCNGGQMLSKKYHDIVLSYPDHDMIYRIVSVIRYAGLHWTPTVNSSSLVSHIYASVNWINTGSDNGLSPIRRQAII